jgi:RHS repeat-associated protein
MVSSIYTHLHAQPKHNYINDVVMPAPNAATLGRFTDIPVDYVTGVPSISVPIYTMKHGPLTLPISLSYHAGGVKLGEPASWVGLNWNLSAGGMITRSVAGLPDDDAAGYYQNGVNLASQLAGDCIVYTSVGTGTKDVEPDIFTVSYPGGSFKFYFDLQKNIIKINKDNDDSIRVFTVGAYVFGGFEVRATNGVRYIFGQENTLTPNCRESTTFSTNNLPFISSWYLTKIITHDGAYTINFTYADENYVMKSKASRQYTFSNVGSGSAGSSGAGSGADISNLPYWSNSITGKRLSSISSGMETINFLANTARLDMDATAYQLDVIEIYPTNASLTYCKRFYLTYDYFQDNNYTYTYAKRLQLKSVQEKSCDNTLVVPPYTFTYSGTVVNGKIFLPHRMSNQIDHWDFYNGKTVNEGLDVNVPSTTMPLGTAYITYGTADRNPDTTYSKQGVITNITYPTGGSATYTYEGNQVAQNVVTGTTTPVNMSTCGTPGPACCGTITVNSSLVNFTSQALLTAKFDLDVVRNPQGPPNNCPTNTDVTASVWNGASQVGVSYSFNLAANQQNGSVLAVPLSAFGTLSAGVNYTFRVVSNNGRGTLKVYYTTNGLQNVVGPGLRIKTIRLNDNLNSANDIVHTYDYSQSGSSLSSANTAVFAPGYGNGYSNILFDGGGFANYGSSLTWSATSIAPLSDFNGNTVMYTRVRDIVSGNGYTEMNYNTSPTNPIQNAIPVCGGTTSINTVNCSAGSCAIPPFPYSAIRGKPSSINIYNQSGSLVKSSTYAYTIINSQSTGVMMKYQYFGSVLIPVFSSNTQVNIYRSGYALRSEKALLTTLTETLDGVSTTTTYEYDASGRHSQPIATNMTNSDGVVTRTQTKYPVDMSASAVRDTLIKRNILVGYENVKLVGGTQIDGSRTNYALFSTHPYPASIDRYESNLSTGSWITKGTYNSYDASGNPTSFNLTNWPAETYTWQNGLIKTRTYQSFVTTYNYVGSNTRILSSIQNVDGQTTSYTYDKLMRLSTGSARGGNVVTTYGYNYFAGAGTRNSVSTSTAFTSVGNSYLTNKTNIQYFDGLGRLVENLTKHPVLGAHDVAFAIDYDPIGRVSKEYIAYDGTGNTGTFIAVPGSQPAKLTTYEPSPLNRPATVTPPSWYATTYAYGSNASNEVNLNGGATFYTAGTVTKETMTDAQGNISHTYKDRKGRVVMTRKVNALDAKTLYAYDAKDRLTMVVPPDATSANTGLTFNYTYDATDHMLTKKVPDANAVTMIYNNRDQLAFVQDGNLAAQSKYMATSYDAYGRVSQSGFATSVATPETPTFTEILSENFYDGWDGSTQLNLVSNPQYQSRLRKSRTKILGSTSDFLTKTYTYDTYGRATNVSGNNHLALANASAESIDMAYDYADNPTTENRTHTNGVATQNYNQRRVYDELARLHDYNVSIAGVENLAARYEYNYRNELITRDQHWGGSAWLQKIDYSYNDQSWLTSINQSALGNTGTVLAFPTCTTQVVTPPLPALGASDDSKDLFYMQLQYDALYTGVSGTLRKDGNISQAVWRVRGRERQAYSYAYDGLQRISTASYSDISEAGTVTASNRYNTSYNYADLRGNFSNVQRNGQFLSGSCYTQALLDNMTYSYNAGTNQISSISDAANATQGGYRAASGAFTYDANGNIKTYAAKGISNINYNHLNLPTLIDFGGGKVIEFTYSSGGNKLKKVVKNTGGSILYTEDYVEGIEYKNGIVEAIYHLEGRLFNNAGIWQKEYTIKDHLGDTRITYSDINNDGVIATPSEILQENNYDAFGYGLDGVYMNHSNPDNQYQYNGKELNNDFALNWMDFGLRWYDASIGRFTSVDPIIFKFPFLTPYNFASNDPIANIDLWGLQGTRYDIIFEQRQQRLLKGEISLNQYNDENTAAGVPALIALSVIAPGPEDAVLAGLGATRIGGVVLKFAVKIIDKVADIFKVGEKVIDVEKALTKTDAFTNTIKEFADPKFANQLSKNLAQQGEKSIRSTAKSLQKNITEHQSKLEKLKEAGGKTSSVEREIRTFNKQLETVKAFAQKNNIELK